MSDLKTSPNIHRLLLGMLDRKASDLHLSAGCRPYMRIDGDMVELEDEPVLSASEAEDLVFGIMPTHIRDAFGRTRDTDFGYELPECGRFRANVFVDHRGLGAVFRLIPSKILSVDDLDLPPVTRTFCALKNGLVIVTGPTGSGKSTTLAGMVDLINATRSDHIITIEDPIEFVHRSRRCLINQRELHTHTDTFAAALRAALREDPDIVLVGEMRDTETVETALETAETGHLVLGTLHTTTAATTVDRIIDMFPSQRQNHIRTMLAGSLRAVVAQTLCRRIDQGRVAAVEVLVVTPGIASNIRDGQTHQVTSSMQTGKAHGMQVLNDDLLRLVREGTIHPAEARRQAAEKADMDAKLKAEGILLDAGKLADPAAASAQPRRSRSSSGAVSFLRAEAERNPTWEGLNNLAWILATHPDRDIQNGVEAEQLAHEAARLAGGDRPEVLDTLAAALALNGHHNDAVAVARQAIQGALSEGKRSLAEGINLRMKCYRAGKPFMQDVQPAG